MNLPTTIPQGIARPTPSPTGPWWERMLMFGDPIPTEYLAQVPAKWPYTAYGIGGKVGRTTKWPLTDVNRTGSTVAWVYASVLWNPRPLVEGKKGKEKEGEGEVWQPLLEGWTQGFLTETAIATGFGTTMGSTTAMGVSRTKASSETKTSATKTKASSTSDKDESSTTGISLGTSKGVRPNMTQSAVLPKDSDAGDFVSGSAIQDVKSKTDTAPMGFGGYVIPTGQHKVRQSTG